jgi:hypothetical protein
MTPTQRKVLLETGVYAKSALDELDAKTSLLDRIKAVIDGVPANQVCVYDEWVELRKLVSAHRS